MIEVKDVPLDGQFVAVWEYGGKIWSNSFLFKGKDEEGIDYFVSWDPVGDSWNNDNHQVGFFTQYPHKIFVIEEE